jgi:branched-chain amino acid transport system permease protein
VNAFNFTIKTWVRILLVASYDLLLVMRVIMSFAHVMFFGVDAYGVSLPLYAVGTNWSALVIGLIAATALALAIRLFSLGVQSIFFAMATRAVAFALQRVRFAALDGDRGEDGRSFKFPEALAGRPQSRPVQSIRRDHRKI